MSQTASSWRLDAKHPLAIRWFHWINFPVLALMLWSGLLIYWAWQPYRLGLGGVTLVHLFPPWVHHALGTESRLAEGMSWHFVFGWVFALNGLGYVTYLAASGAWRELVPRRGTWAAALAVVKHDLGLSTNPLPKAKFNAAQRLAYSSVVLMGLGSLLTGLAIYKPVQLGWLTFLLGGYRAARLWHFLLTLGYLGFFVVHVVQVARAGWNNFRAMVTGYELVPRQEDEHEQAA